MNFTRVGLAAVAAWLVYLALGFLIHGVMLADLWATLQRSGVARSSSTGNALMPLGFALAFPGLLAFTYAYAKGYEGGPGSQEGLRFGALIGLVIVAFGVTWSYVSFPLPLEYLTSMAAATVVQFAAVGMVVGIVYRPVNRAAGLQ
ncbi:MAG: hypothetical protein M3R55_13155 [Acidobacteriota bacterium]|nr:hypothetical protein [Acidobacteriota bacterium]